MGYFAAGGGKGGGGGGGSIAATKGGNGLFFALDLLEQTGGAEKQPTRTISFVFSFPCSSCAVQQQVQYVIFHFYRKIRRENVPKVTEISEEKMWPSKN